jgi:hypothetical protein
MKNVEVGMFRMPGISFSPLVIPEDTVTEMVKWAKENHCGTCMSPSLWSFRSPAQRDWFILRWSEHFPVPEEDES